MIPQLVCGHILGTRHKAVVDVDKKSPGISVIPGLDEKRQGRGQRL